MREKPAPEETWAEWHDATLLPCECGCGKPINLFHVKARWMHSRRCMSRKDIAIELDVSPAYVTSLLAKEPPRWMRGHAPGPSYSNKECERCGVVFRACGGQTCCGSRVCATRYTSAARSGLPPRVLTESQIEAEIQRLAREQVEDDARAYVRQQDSLDAPIRLGNGGHLDRYDLIFAGVGRVETEWQDPVGDLVTRVLDAKRESSALLDAPEIDAAQFV